MFSAEAILDATAQVAAEHGPSGATIGSIARRLGGPTGSIYHRFASRDVLFAELWLQLVDAFQSGFVAALSGPDPRRAGLDAALHTPRWVRTHPVPARLLLVHHRDDFVSGGWPPEVADRAARLAKDMDKAIRSFARRALGGSGADALRRARFALVEIPGAAVRGHLRSGEVLPDVTEDLVTDAYLAVVPRRSR